MMCRVMVQMLFLVLLKESYICVRLLRLVQRSYSSLLLVPVSRVECYRKEADFEGVRFQHRGLAKIVWTVPKGMRYFYIPSLDFPLLLPSGHIADVKSSPHFFHNYYRPLLLSTSAVSYTNSFPLTCSTSNAYFILSISKLCR